MTQSGILAPVPAHARVLHLDLNEPARVASALASLATLSWGDHVLGLGPELVAALDSHVQGLAPFPQFAEARVAVPITQHGLLLLLRGKDPGELVMQEQALLQLLSPAFVVKECESAFKFREGRDLTGYEDGTENPEERAAEVALIQGTGAGIDGGSFMAIQTFVHDLQTFHGLPTSQQDNIIGRRLSDNEELEDAPETAHVKRTAQESFEPEAFILRRSMPLTRATENGLLFVAYGASLAPYSALLRRMVGAEDGLVDALFSFSRPRSGAVYFCPPLLGDRLDLSAVLKD
jgi:porphyrinogen peroxidase